MAAIGQFDGYIWLNNTFIKSHDAKIHIAAHSLHYAGSVFEGIRIYNTKPFKQLDHYKRLCISAEAMGYSIQYSPEYLCDITNQLINMNQLQDGYIRPIAWRGGEDHHINGHNCTINIAIIAYNPFDLIHNRAHGLRLCIAKWRKAHQTSLPFYAKGSGLYMMSTIIQNEAIQSGFDDALVLDQEGFLTEATTSNFFFIKDNILYTPISDCFLNGITRQTVINEIAPSLNLKVIEGKFLVSFMHGAHAAFLTGTAAGIKEIASIHHEEDIFHFAIHQDILERIKSAYSQLVEA